MPRLNPKSIAHDFARENTYLLATHGKNKYLLELRADGDMSLKLVRKVTAPSETFWIAPDSSGKPQAVFWSIGKSFLIPLSDENAKAKTLKNEGKGDDDDKTFELESVVIPAKPDRARELDRRLFRVLDRKVFELVGDRWAVVDGSDNKDGDIVLATLRGAYRRRLAGVAADWKLILEHKKKSVVATNIASTPSGSHCLLGTHGGTSQLIDLATNKATPIDLDTIWGAVGCADGFFVWSSYRVWKVGLDGKATDTGITEDQEAADTSLFRTSKCVLFIQEKHIHRYRKGQWTQHDIGAAGAKIGLT